MEHFGEVAAVAGFVGQANFLPGRADGKVVDTELGPLLALDDPGATAVEVLLRPEDLVLEHVAQGRLVRVLEDWCEPFSGYHLYYPSRRQSSPAFTLLRETLRYPQPLVLGM